MSVTDFLWLSRLNSICWQSIGFKISLCPSRNKRRVFRGRWPITSSAVCTNPASPLFCFAPSPTQIMPNLSASALEPFPIEKSFFPEPSPLIAIVNLGSCFAIFLRFCCTRSSFSFGYVAAFSAPLEGLLSAWPEPVPGLPEGVHGFAPSANLHQPPYQNQYLLSLRRYTSHQADSLQLISPPLRSSRCAHKPRLFLCTVPASASLPDCCCPATAVSVASLPALPSDSGIPNSDMCSVYQSHPDVQRDKLLGDHSNKYPPELCWFQHPSDLEPLSFFFFLWRQVLLMVQLCLNALFRAAQIIVLNLSPRRRATASCVSTPDLVPRTF